MTEEQKRYEHLADLVRKMMAAQRACFKGDKKSWAIAKNYEKKVEELISPEKEKQRTLFNWLAQ